MSVWIQPVNLYCIHCAVFTLQIYKVLWDNCCHEWTLNVNRAYKTQVLLTYNEENISLCIVTAVTSPFGLCFAF